MKADALSRLFSSLVHTYAPGAQSNSEVAAHRGRRAGNCIEGRRPAGLVGTGDAWLTTLAAHMAEVAHMEAAAVVAFSMLEDDLARIGAPGSLLRRVTRARFQEIEHTQIMTAVAQSMGRTPRAPSLTATPVERALFDIALENAVEGCVREAYGALVATYQGTYAEDPKVRAAFARIAPDETSHAELSHDIEAWLDERLMPHERKRIALLKAQAWRDLEKECATEPSADVCIRAGMPRARVARVLVASLAARTTKAA